MLDDFVVVTVVRVGLEVVEIQVDATRVYVKYPVKVIGTFTAFVVAKYAFVYNEISAFEWKTLAPVLARF